MEIKLKEETENIKKMRKQLEDMLGELVTMAKNGPDIPHEIPGALTDMIKDLSEAEEHIAECCKATVEIEYKKKITEAMEKAEKEKELLEKAPVLGYSRMHYPEMDPLIDRTPVMGYQSDGMRYTGPPGSHDSVGTGRLGYDDPLARVSDRGRNYDTYKELRRHYSGSQDPEGKKKMTDSIDRVFDDMESIIMEVWPDIEAIERGKYIQKGQKLMSRLQSMA